MQTNIHFALPQLHANLYIGSLANGWMMPLASWLDGISSSTRLFWLVYILKEPAAMY